MERLKALTTQFLAARPSLMAYIASMVRDPAAAEDLYQEVWLQLADAVERDVPIDDPPRWFRGVARNRILMHWRKQRRSENSVRADSRLLEAADRAFARHDATPDWWTDRRGALRECVSKLPGRSKRLVRLSYEESRTLDEIARAAGATYGSIATALTRIRQALLECMRRKLRLKEGNA